ncbi:MAG TPA: fructosamine kinase family protein [Woeseiaceae bacterium]|nr:fructosamine kinase family protein [Woeseiaceae bacterium]
MPDWQKRSKHREAFVKTAPVHALPMFEAEAEGLAALAATKTIRVPDVLDVGIQRDKAFIALEWLDLAGLSPDLERELGTQLARLHRHSADRFGWHRDNAIGPTAQQNSWCEQWVEFFRQHRLQSQLALARENAHTGEIQELGEQLAANLELLFGDYEPLPSLLHGDLWAGNAAAAKGVPVIFDPAVYFGDRESDIAMTRLFGGFGHAFYSAYTSEWPMAAGYEQRQKLYQLYHVLNHLNLFGTTYLGRAMTLLKDLGRTIHE